MNWMKKHSAGIIWFIVITFAVGFSWLSISSYVGNSGSRSNAQNTVNPSQAIAVLTAGGTTLASKYWVMPSEVQSYMKTINSNYKNQYGQDPDSLFVEPNLELGAIKQLVDQSVVDYFANSNNITVTSGEVDSQLKSLVSQYTSNQNTKNYIMQQYGSIKNFEDQIRPNVEQNLLTQKVLSVVANVTQNDVKNYYEANKTSIENQYDQVKAAHILVSSKATAEVVLKLIDSKKITFADAAKKYSIDTGSATNGGELGWFTRSQMVKPFSDAAFNGKVGQIVGPVQSQYGWHLIDIQGQKFYDTFNAVLQATTVYNDLVSKVKQQMYTNWVNKYKKEKDISYTLEGQVMPYIQAFSTVPSTNATRLYQFIQNMNSYVYPSTSTTINTSIDPRLLALYETALETYKKTLTTQNATLESYNVNAGTFPASYSGIPLTELQKRAAQVDSEMQTATGTNFSKLFNEKIDLQKAVNYYTAVDQLHKMGYKTDADIKSAYQAYNKKVNEISAKIKQVLEALYGVAPYSTQVVSKLYSVEPSNKKVASQYFQNQYNLIKPILSNQQAYQAYASQITPMLQYITSGLESLSYSAPSTTLKQNALVTLVTISQNLGQLNQELGYLKRLKSVNPNYQGIDQVITQVENQITAASTAATKTSVSAAGSTSSTPTLQIPSSGK